MLFIESQLACRAGPRNGAVMVSVPQVKAPGSAVGRCRASGAELGPGAVLSGSRARLGPHPLQLRGTADPTSGSGLPLSSQSGPCCTVPSRRLP